MVLNDKSISTLMDIVYMQNQLLQFQEMLISFYLSDLQAKIIFAVIN